MRSAPLNTGRLGWCSAGAVLVQCWCSVCTVVVQLWCSVGALQRFEPVMHCSVFRSVAMVVHFNVSVQPTFVHRAKLLKYYVPKI